MAGGTGIEQEGDERNDAVVFVCKIERIRKAYGGGSFGGAPTEKSW